MKSIRVNITGHDGKTDGIVSMTGIQVMFDDGIDFHAAKAKALGYIVQELCRYGLHEALNGIGILDEHGKRRNAEVDAMLIPRRIAELERKMTHLMPDKSDDI